MNLKRLSLLMASVFFYLGLTAGSLGELIEIDTNTNLKAVYLIEDPDNALFQVNLVVLAGEVDARGPEGLAHYLEHLMFWHADKVNNKPFHGRGGNAWINGIITNYHNSGNEAELDDLFAFAARLTTKPDLDRKFMIEERDVVAREYDLRVSENPHRKAYDTIAKALFLKNPVGRSTIGTLDSIHALTINQAFDFHSQYYVPENMVLIISGNLSPEEVKKRAEKAFGGRAKSKSNSKTWYFSPVDETDKKLIEAEDSHVVSGSYKVATLTNWKGSGEPIADWYTIQFVQSLLVSALPGSLAKPLRIDNFVAREFEVYLNEAVEGQVVFGLHAIPDEGVSFEELGNTTFTSLSSLSKSGIPQKTLERLQKRWLQVAERRGSQADYIRARSLQLLTAGLPLTNSQDHRKYIESIKKSQINSLLEALANPLRRIEYHLTKKEN